MNVRLFFVYLCIFSNILYTTYAQDIDECTRGSDNCDNNADCTNTIGSFTCQCKNGYSGNGVTCSDIDDCTRGTDNCHNNANCTNTIGSFTCQCKDGYSGNGVSCSEINECQSVPCKNGGTCTDLINAYRCTCVNGYSSTNCEVAAIGASCSQSGTYCSDPNGFCQSNGQGEQTCQCKSMHYDNDSVNNIGGICTSKVGLGQNCPMPNACFTSNSECVGDTCRCTNNYYDTNIATTDGGSCESRHNLGEVCSKNHSNTKQCVDPNATCRGSSYICSCDDRYHKEGSRCVPNVALSGTCTGTADAECSDPNAECVSTKCTCSVGYYRFNGSNSQSNCKDVTELRVTGITFSNVQTTEFTVSWTAPSRSSYVSGYDVEWQSGSTIEGASSPRRVSGLIPGKRYDVKVISKDTTTQPGVTRTTYSSKEQATKPIIPGGVTSTSDDLNASNGQIDIRWTKGNGVATRYRIKLFDGDSEKGYKETSSTSTVFSGVLNGHRYNVVITARSEQFNGNYIWSEERTSQIKTKVQVPGQPRNGVCKSPTDSAITLEWDIPTFPNGDLKRYHIDVLDTGNKLLFKDVTTGTETQKVVGNLQPGTSYSFRLYTENEQYNSTGYYILASSCNTKAKMCDPPTNLKLSGVTSRGFDIAWDKPNNTYSEENYGYVLQIKDDEGSCWKEVIYRCSDCRGGFTLSELDELCDSTKREPIVDKTKTELANKLMYIATLDPDISYTISVTAINDAGRGRPATVTQRTLEEAPQKPYEVIVVVKNATAVGVTWKLDGPRPGQTTYLITLIADAPASSKNFTVSGFGNKEYTASRLQEYWNYSVLVTASTSIGSSRSAMTDKYRTLPAAPGKVSEFMVENSPDGDYTKMRISWKMPTVLERNGVISNYMIQYFASGMVAGKMKFNQESEDYMYSVIIDVKPEEIYSITVYAINGDGIEGEKHSVIEETPAGVPPNYEKNENRSIVSLTTVQNIQKTQFIVNVVGDFFTNDTYGAIRTSGLVLCKKRDCDISRIKTKSDFNYMDNIKTNKDMFRITRVDWLIKLKQGQLAKGSEKCSANELEYIVGKEDCFKLDPGEYCNGPLQPGTTYFIFGVVCTNGGCLISQPYGPFVTNTAQFTEECNSSGTQSIVIGLVLGFIILLLAVYAGYLTFKIRRIQAKDVKEENTAVRKAHISQIYVNETFSAGTSDVPTQQERASGDPETEYSTLDDKSRDGTTYERLRPGH